MLDLSELANEMLTRLAEASGAITAARYADMPDETHRVYLAHVKASVEHTTAALVDLQRQTESAGWLFENRENFIGAMEAMQRQELELSKVLNRPLSEPKQELT